MWKFFQPKYKHVWLWQEFKLCHTGTHHVAFLCFSKDKSPELQYHQEQDKQQLRPSHIRQLPRLRSSIATHEFQVQSKFSCQNSHIQNSREFKAANQVLERNYKELLFIISILRDYLQSPFYFIQLLKQIKANWTHSLYFVFMFQITHYNYIYFYKVNFYFVFSYSSFF